MAGRPRHQPDLSVVDPGYAGLDNLKLGWHWFTRLKTNRLVSVEGNRKNRPVAARLILRHGRIIHLKGYGWVKVFKTVTPDGREEYRATRRLGIHPLLLPSHNTKSKM